MGVVTLLGTNISPEKPILKMVFLFPRWDMLISQRVYQRSLDSFIGLLVPVGCLGFKSSNQATEAWKEVGEDTTSTRCRCCGCVGESHLNLKNIRDEWMNTYIYIYIIFIHINTKMIWLYIIYVSDNHQFSSSSSFHSCFFCGYVKETNNKTKRRLFFPYEGELGAERLMELLAASFDWDASLRDPSAALAYLGRKPEEKLDYEELVGGGWFGGWLGVGMGVFWSWWDGGNGESSWWGLVEHFYKGFLKSQYW